MKKILKFNLTIISLTILLFLTACSNTKQTALQRFDSSGYDERVTIYYQDDKAIKQVTRYEVKIDQLESDDPKFIKKSSEGIQEFYEEYEGISYTFDIQDDEVLSTLEIDFEKLPAEDANSLLAWNFESLIKDDYISHQKLVKLLKNSGYKIIKNGNFQELSK